MRTLNQIQSLTTEQQQRCYFAIVATNQTQADGTCQNNQQAMVRLRNGSYVYVRDLPAISNTNPQPNGDYSITLSNNHSDDVADQSGVGWLFLGADGSMHMMYMLSLNPAANSIRGLADDGILQFSTEGYCESMGDDGVYGDFWITAVAPCKVGNDPGTQSVDNKLDKDNKMDKDEIINVIDSKIKAAKVANKAMTPADVMTAAAELFGQLGITDPKWISDVTSDLINAAAGLPYDADKSDKDKPADDSAQSDTTSGTDSTTSADNPAPADPNQPIAATNSKRGNKVHQIIAGNVKQPTANKTGIVHVGAEKVENLSKSEEYLNAWGLDMLNSFKGVKGRDTSHVNNYLKQNDISFADDVTIAPEYVVTKITELLQSDNSVLSKISFNDGLMSFSVPGFVTSTSYAHGRGRKQTSEKDNQTATIGERLITAQSLFKYVSLPADFIDNAGGLAGAAVAKWVTRELPSKVIRAAEEALVVGGVMNDEKQTPTPYTAIKSIVGDVTEANSPYGEVFTRPANMSLLKALSSQVANVELLDNAMGDTGIYVIMSRVAYRNLLNEATIGSGDFPANLATDSDSLAEYLGVDGILQLPWLRPNARETGHNPNIDTFMATYDALIVNLSAVEGCGEMSPSSLSQYYLRANTYDFEAKMRIGAALAAPHSAVLIAKPTTPNNAQ